MSSGGKSAAEEAVDSKPIELSARAGLIAYGIIHILVGWLALLMGWDQAAPASPDLSGALRTVAMQPFGMVVLWVIAAGLMALAFREAGEAIWGSSNESEVKWKRAGRAAKALIYAATGVSAARFALGAGSASAEDTEEAASGAMTLPAGRLVVGMVGIVIIVVGVRHVIKGLQKSFLEEMATSAMSPAVLRSATLMGRVGYMAKGIAIGIVGGLLTYTAATFDPREQGLDGALQAVLVQPSGPYWLSGLAVGLIAFGLFAILQSRFRRM